MDEKSLIILEFPKIREILAGFTSFSASKNLALNLQPLSDYEQISLLLRQSAEARHLLASKPGFAIGGVLDVSESAKMAKLGKTLETRTILAIQETIAAMRRLRNNLSKIAKECPLLWDIAETIEELPHLEEEIVNCLSSDGEVLDSASTQLALVRRQLKQARQHLLDRLEAIIKSPRGRRIIQEPIITEREGRYVIPIKAEFRKEVKGLVHDVSNTGSTVFIEPWTTLELGNELRELMMEERREVERILKDLSREIGAHETEISSNIALVATIDLALAKARYAEKVKANEPILITFDSKRDGIKTGEQAVTLKLVEARHPLLAEKAVPLSLEVGNNFSVMVITGPNTGGKTVALKTIGLLSLMAQAGMPIPALAESCLLVFDDIFADIGDEQSIEQTLSTFSWHMGNIVRIVKNASRSSLVLLDELGTSTDPTEGSALARSILQHFLQRGTMVVATTHYGDLKTFAHATPGIQNASLDFDPVTLTPTYHLTIGIPGGSNALATASRLGLPVEIITNAKNMLSKGTHELDILLKDLMVERRKIDALRRDLERHGREQEQQNIKLKSEIARLKREEQRNLQETRDRILREAADLHKQVRQVASELRKEKTRERIEQAKQAITAVHQQLGSDHWQPRVGNKIEAEAMDVNAMAPGDIVWIKGVNLPAIVMAISKETRQAEVQAGHTKISINIDGLEKVESAAAEGITQYASPIKTQLSKQPTPLELDLRGKHAGEIEPIIDRYLNDAYLASLKEIRIIHGVGTGTVCKITRELLASHPLVESFRPGKRGEGDDGVTVVKL